MDPKPSTSDGKRADLDAYSESFDASKAIFNPNFVFPDPDAPICDNVEKFIKRYELGGPPAPKPASKPAPEVTGGRLFSQDQMPVTRTRKSLPNVLTFMDKMKNKGGPMSVMSECVEQRKRVKVLVRGIDRMRGNLVGFLIAFDKHWNLALSDVEETFTRKRYRKCASNLNDKTEPASKTDSKSQIGFSTYRIFETLRKHEVVKRHVPQVVLRGEHVACVLPL